MPSALAPLVGALITVMSHVNSRLAAFTGNLAAMVVIHAAGLAAVSAVLLVKREEPGPGRLPAVYYLGGVVGVGTVFCSISAFTALGASFAVALALLGQALASLVVDAAGFLGRPRFPVTARSAPGILLAAAGAAVMVDSLRSDAPGMAAALVSGILPVLTFALNSELGRRRGILRSTRINYVTGLATTLVIAALAGTRPAEAARAAAAAGPLLALGGGIMGVGVVAGMNFIFPRVSALSATLLVFCGQALTGVLIDAGAAGHLEARRLAGTVILLAGLAVHARLTMRRRVPGAPAR